MQNTIFCSRTKDYFVPDFNTTILSLNHLKKETWDVR